ncbi:13611_t:CDS:2 [Gigaspora rosea]|nr:13611_t:CDS:2 [Gigaspora rosea]
MAGLQTAKLIFAKVLDIFLGITIFLCPSLAIAKYELFKQSGGQLRLNSFVENGYIIISLILPCIIILVITGNCRWGIRTPPDTNEMGNIPISCPNDYNYSSSSIKTACQIRLANLISMWALFGISIIFVLAVFTNMLPEPKDKLKAGKGNIPQRFRKDKKEVDEEQISAL